MVRSSSKQLPLRWKMARPPSDSSSIYSRLANAPEAAPLARHGLPEITALDHQTSLACGTTMALQTTRALLKSAKDHAQSSQPDPIAEKRRQRDRQEQENELYRTFCRSFCQLATTLVGITQQFVLDQQLDQGPFRPMNARLCSVSMVLWAALDVSEVAEAAAKRQWMRELDIMGASRPSFEWI